jgi:diguanylate cyclase (GGDEF)-like protein
MLEQARETLVLLSCRGTRGGQQAREALRERATERSALEPRTHRDPLTGLHGRLWADHALREMYEEARRSGAPFTLALCDVDRFRLVNDGYGEDVGDAVLVAVAGALARGVRDADAVVRWGDDRFLLALPDTDADGAAAVAGRARQRVAQVAVEGPAREPLRVSISVGHVTLRPAAPCGGLAELLAAAEQALGAAKRAGRDRSVAGEPSR